jgi:hypothetical protein
MDGDQPSQQGNSSERVEIAPEIGAREAELERWARRRVKSLRLFYTHLSIFAIVNVLLLLIGVSTPGAPWFYKVLLGWGLLVGLHAAYAYEMLPWTNRDWERRKMEEMMERQRGRLQHRRAP